MSQNALRLQPFNYFEITQYDKQSYFNGKRKLTSTSEHDKPSLERNHGKQHCLKLSTIQAATQDETRDATRQLKWDKYWQKYDRSI